MDTDGVVYYSVFHSHRFPNGHTDSHGNANYDTYHPDPIGDPDGSVSHSSSERRWTI
jgi:hypothetical protein